MLRLRSLPQWISSGLDCVAQGTCGVEDMWKRCCAVASPKMERRICVTAGGVVRDALPSLREAALRPSWPGERQTYREERAGDTRAQRDSRWAYGRRNEWFAADRQTNELFTTLNCELASAGAENISTKKLRREPSFCIHTTAGCTRVFSTVDSISLSLFTHLPGVQSWILPLLIAGV